MIENCWSLSEHIRSRAMAKLWLAQSAGGLPAVFAGLLTTPAHADTVGVIAPQSIQGPPARSPVRARFLSSWSGGLNRVGGTANA